MFFYMYIIFYNNNNVDKLITTIISIMALNKKYSINNNTLDKMLINTDFDLSLN